MTKRRRSLAPVAPVMKMIRNEAGLFIEIDGVRIAQRGYPGTPQAKTWVSLEPGWKVIDDRDTNTIVVEHDSVRVH
jgi:hypothetical protein